MIKLQALCLFYTSGSYREYSLNPHCFLKMSIFFILEPHMISRYSCFQKRNADDSQDHRHHFRHLGIQSIDENYSDILQHSWRRVEKFLADNNCACFRQTCLVTTQQINPNRTYFLHEQLKLVNLLLISLTYYSNLKSYLKNFYVNLISSNCIFH